MEDWIVVIGSVLGLFVAGGVAVLAVRSERLLTVVQTTKTVTVARAIGMATPSGHAVQVAGLAKTDQPLSAPVSGTSCVYYRHLVEKYVFAGKTSYWETTSDERQYVPFRLRDSTGSIDVLLKDSEVIPKMTAKDVPLGKITANDSTLGPYSHSIWGPKCDGNLKQTEWVLAEDSNLDVFGSVVQTDTGPRLQKGAEPFVASCELNRELQRTYRLQSYGFLALAVVVGLISVAVGLYALTHRGPQYQNDILRGFAIGVAIILLSVGTGVMYVVRRYGIPSKEQAVLGLPTDPLAPAPPPVPPEPTGKHAVMPASLVKEIAAHSAPGAEVSSTQMVPAEKAATPPAASSRPGVGVGVIQHDIFIGNMVAFKQGERVEVESESPDPERPEYRYAVFSQSLNKRLRLSDMDIFL